MPVFSHAGGFAAICYALPIIRALGGGELVLTPSESTSLRLNRERFRLIAPLLDRQPYLARVDWSEFPRGVRLDEWRLRPRSGLNISDQTAQLVGVPHPEREQPWLFVEPRRVARVVIHRALRRMNWNFPWKRIWDEYRHDAVLVGLPEEHRDFTTFIGPIDYHPTADLHELAQVIAGCDLFVGNQSAPYAIAEGLKVPTILELYPPENNCHWERRGNRHGRGADLDIPRVQDLAERALHSVIGRAKGHTLINEPRLLVLAREAQRTAVLPGVMAELGVFRGGSAKVISSQAPGKTLHLFDTFRGLPSDDVATGGHRQGEFAADVGEVRTFLQGYPVEFHVGEFPATTRDLPDDVRFSFVHLDADIYQSTVAAIDYFWPRMVPEGVIVFDDYHWPRCPGVAQAIEERLSGVPVEVGSYQAWIRKPAR